MDLSFTCETADNVFVRVKPLIITKADVKGSIAAKMRNMIVQFLIKAIKKMSYDEVLNDLISHKLQSLMRENFYKIYPLKVCEIRYFGVEQREHKQEAKLEDAKVEVAEAKAEAAKALAAQKSEFDARLIETGAAIQAVAKQATDAIAQLTKQLDASRAETKLLREHQGMNLVAQILQLPFPDNIFDAVVAFDILEHIDQDEGAVQEIHRVLKPKGKLLFVVPEDMTLFSPIDVANGHFRRYNLESIRELLAAFNLVNLSDFGFPLMRLYLRLFAKRLLAVRSQNSPTFLVRVLSPFVVGVFHFDRLFNGSFRGVEIFGVAQKPG